MKKTMTIIIAALLICTFAGCRAASSTETQSEASSSGISYTNMINDDEAEGIDDIAYDAQASDASDTIAFQTENEEDQSRDNATASSGETEESSADSRESSIRDNNSYVNIIFADNDESKKSESEDTTKNSSVKTSDSTSQGASAKTSDHTSQSFSEKSSDSTSQNSSAKPSDSSSQSSSAKTSDTTVQKSTGNTSTEKSSSQGSTSSAETTSTVYTANTSGKIDTSDLFSNRDLTQSPDLSDAETIQAASNKTVTLTEAGIYILTGTATNFTVRVEADKEAKVQLVLDNLNVTNSSTPVIYVVSADKCFVTTNGNTSTLSVTGTFTADGDTNTDAVIFSKDDLVLNGTGTLKITSSYGNGISGKDDIKITGGTYIISSAKDSIEANDSIAIYDGTFTITSSKDGLHSENDDDDTVGWIYIQNGTFTIKASNDAIQATTVCQLDGGSFNLTSSEGIESTYIQINGGNINISATDDGINASQKSKSIGTPTFEITGGSLTVTMNGSDVDCIDANGNIIVSGGTINVTYPVQGPSESFDYDGTAAYTGGTIIINGTQVSAIPQNMMGGGMGGHGGFGR